MTLTELSDTVSDAQVAWNDAGVARRLAFTVACAERIALDIEGFRASFVEDGLSTVLAETFSGGLLVNDGRRLRSVAPALARVVRDVGGRSRGELLVRRPDGLVLLRAPAHAATVALVGVLEILLAGNAVILLASSPSSTCSRFAALLEEVAAAHGLGAGIFRIHIERSRTALPLALGSAAIASIVFYGSEVAGKEIASLGAAAGKKVLVELTATNALIVWHDADVPAAARAAADGFLLSGRPCIAPHNVLCHPAVATSLRAAIETLAGSLRSVAHDRSGGTLFPLGRADAERTRTTFAQHARITHGGEITDEAGSPSGDGHYLAPLVAEVESRALVEESSAALMAPELLAPVSLIVKLDESAPLASLRVLLARYGRFHRVSAWTSSPEVITTVAQACPRSGALVFNQPHTSDALLGGFFVRAPAAEGASLWEATSNQQTVRCAAFEETVLAALGVRDTSTFTYNATSASVCGGDAS